MNASANAIVAQNTNSRPISGSGSPNRLNGVKNSQKKKAHAYQFKKTMIPLLIVVAAVLLIMGTVAVFIPTGGEQAVQPDNKQAPQAETEISKFRPLLVMASFVVGAVLLLGAWMFYTDIRRADQRAAAQRRKAEEAESSPGRPMAP